MSTERPIFCQLDPMLDCPIECDLNLKGSDFLNEFSEGLQIPEEEVTEKLRSQFSMLEPKEQGKMIMDKITVLEEKEIDTSSCLKFNNRLK